MLPKKGASVRVKGLEPSRISPPDPKSGAAANYAIPAMLAFECVAKLTLIVWICKFLMIFYLKRHGRLL